MDFWDSGRAYLTVRQKGQAHGPPLGGIYQGSIDIRWVPLKNYVAACVDGRSNKLSTPVDSTTLHDPKSLSTVSLEICYYSSLKSCRTFNTNSFKFLKYFIMTGKLAPSSLSLPDDLSYRCKQNMVSFRYSGLPKPLNAEP